jgi:PIN domain nuclease of toxin-antitoxin system
VHSSALDAPALLALLNAEPGGAEVRAALAVGAAISAVNWSEVVSKLSEAGMSEAEIRAVLDPFARHVIAFDDDLAYRAGLLRPATKAAGLSLGDRACLALAQRLGVPALTADRGWQGLSIGVAIRVIR